jgi:hypothetical protein
MEKFELSVNWKKENYHFEVRDYMHHDGEQCKYEIFQNGQFIGGLEPHHKILQVCKNPGVVKDELLHVIAEQLEGYNL